MRLMLITNSSLRLVVFLSFMAAAASLLLDKGKLEEDEEARDSNDVDKDFVHRVSHPLRFQRASGRTYRGGRHPETDVVLRRRCFIVSSGRSRSRSSGSRSGGAGAR